MSGKGSNSVKRDEDGRVEIHINTGYQVNENENKKEDRTATRVIRDGSGAVRIEIITEEPEQKNSGNGKKLGEETLTRVMKDGDKKKIEITTGEYRERLGTFYGFTGDRLFDGCSPWETMALYQEYYSGRSNREYVVGESIIGCEYGSNLTRIYIGEDHGIYNRNGDAVLTCGDCKPEEHIYTFGVCGSPKALEKSHEIVTIPGTAPYASPTVKGPKCAMVLSPEWTVGNVHTHIWNEKTRQYEKALIEDGVLTCMYGNGIITVREVKNGKDDTVRIKVTLEQMSGEGEMGWRKREVTGYNLNTSIPEYKEDRDGGPITQEDVDELNRVMDEYEINRNIERVRHFLAQCHHESNRGLCPIEQFGKAYNSPLEDPRFKNYEGSENGLGNVPGSGDGYKYRGAGAIQITGKDQYRVFSEYMNDPRILSDGALYVGQNYYWEVAGFFWSVYKPGSCVDTISRKPGDEWPIFRKENYPDKVCMFDLNGNCDLGALYGRFRILFMVMLMILSVSYQNVNDIMNITKVLSNDTRDRKSTRLNSSH